MTVLELIVDCYNQGYRDGYAEGCNELAQFHADMIELEEEECSHG